MRKILLASAAMLTATAGGAFAQEKAQLVESAYSGIRPNAPASAAGANNNNNIQAAALPGPTAVPTPGTFVVRLGGRVNVEAGAGWSNVDKINLPAGTALNAVAIQGATGAQTTATLVQPTGTAANGAIQAKRNPTSFGAYFRLYPGLDAMATNGLRYGAGVELRTNWGSNASGGSGETSGQTMFVRRDFVYLAGDNWGLFRFGQADGVIGLFDGGVTTGQNWSNSGVLNGGDAQAITPSRTAIPFYWMSLAGNEYGSTKAVYITPKIFGFEGGVSFAPAPGNAYSDGSNSPYTLTANCAVASNNCYGLSSSSAAGTATQYTNLYQAGIRYLNDIGPVNVRAYGVYVGSDQVSYTGVTPAGTVTGLYDPLSVYNAGVALTYAGFTAAVNYIGGAMNGQFVLKPAGGANLNAVTPSLQYVTGPLTLGVSMSTDTAQGSAGLVGKTQLSEQQLSAGGRYVVAPGLAVSADYLYMQRRQNGFNWQTGALNAAGAAYDTNSRIQAQTFLLGIAVNW